MSSVTHPDDGVLLRYLDGELTGRKSRQVRRHLEACWDCRAGVESLERSIAGCVQYRKQVLQVMLPEPPAPWGELSSGFARIDSEVGVESWAARMGRWLTAPSPLRWSMAAVATLIVAFGVYYQLHETPSVQAAALLQRAVALSAHSAPARPIRVRTNVKNRAVIPAMLRAARYPAGEPLSARSFQGWRDGLADKKDEVSTIADPELPEVRCYRIRTVAEGGELAAASLLLRVTDLHPVEGRFEFRNQDWVEYREVSEALTTDGGTPAVTRDEAPMRRVVPSRPAVPSGETASISEELRVLAALHGIGADLGDPIEITRESDRVLVHGVGIPAERQRKIADALRGIPHAATDFSEPADAPDSGDLAVVTPGTKPQTGRPAAQSRLELQLGGRAEFEKLSGQLVEAADAAMARAYALRSLAQRFPAGTDLSAADREVLEALAREHTRVLISQINELHRTLAPVLVSLGGSPVQGKPATSYETWQSAAEGVLRSGRRMELLISTLLGVTPEPSNAHVPSELLASFADLRSALDACQSLL